MRAPGCGVVLMPSASTPGLRYTVRFDGCQRWCDCDGFAYRGRCRHVDRLNAALRALTRPEAPKRTRRRTAA